jgi:hypothetical protein
MAASPTRRGGKLVQASRDEFGHAILKARREPEGRALAKFTLDADFAAHQFDEVMRNRESQAGSSIMPRGGGISLREGLKQPALRFGAQANARINDFDQEHHPIIAGTSFRQLKIH